MTFVAVDREEDVLAVDNNRRRKLPRETIDDWLWLVSVDLVAGLLVTNGRWHAPYGSEGDGSNLLIRWTICNLNRRVIAAISRACCLAVKEVGSKLL